jgi:REP element-mobilizing transposase RayT
VDLRSQLTHATQQHQRHSLRLKDYDYSQEGAYFVTICTHKKALFFENEHISAIVEKCWLAIPVHFPNVQLDEWVIMPNHMHGILIITDKCRTTKYCTNNVYNFRRGDPTGRPYIRPHGPTPDSIGTIIGQFKSIVTRRINKLHGTLGAPFWQRNYYEHVIRNEDDLNEIRQYILDNPVQWDRDENNPDRQIEHSVEFKPQGELICQPK